MLLLLVSLCALSCGRDDAGGCAPVGARSSERVLPLWGALTLLLLMQKEAVEEESVHEEEELSDETAERDTGTPAAAATQRSAPSCSNILQAIVIHGYKQAHSLSAAPFEFRETPAGPKADDDAVLVISG